MKVLVNAKKEKEEKPAQPPMMPPKPMAPQPQQPAMNDPFATSPQERGFYQQLFLQLDKDKTHQIPHDVVLGYHSQSGLPRPVLEKLFAMADLDKDGKLDFAEFVIMTHILFVNRKGVPLPNELPKSLIPPSKAHLVAASPEPEEEEEEEESSNSHHIVIPRYLVVAVCLIVVALIGGMGWFAFNYGQMTAQRDHLAMQLNQYHQAPAKKVPAKPAAAPLSQEQKLRQKAMEDSIRMAKTAEAVKLAENSDEESANAEKAKQTEAKAKAEAKEKAKDKAEEKAASKIASSQYDKDARVRTGAYRIIGVAQTVTVGAGQTLEQISTRYLGSGMECYVEALNGTSTIKAGQKIKIPKLELKKKKK